MRATIAYSTMLILTAIYAVVLIEQSADTVNYFSAFCEGLPDCSTNTKGY